MLFAGHIGTTLGVLSLARFKRHTCPIITGAMLPDIIDKPLGLLIFHNQLGTGRVFGHTLIFLVTLVLFGCLWYLKNQSGDILWLAGGSTIHLIQDQIWQCKEVLFWPVFGSTFPTRDYDLANILNKLFTDPAVYIPEIVGLIGIAWFIYYLHKKEQLYLVIKRALDLTVAILGGIALLPLSLLIAMAIYMQDFGSVFFSQDRRGKGMCQFRLVKFRTMRIPQSGERQVIVNLKNDLRVTKVGKLLRATGLDSIPELINIIKGDMSFVGPRPMPYVIEDEPKFTNIGQVPGVDIRSSVIPGLTGLAQIYASKYSTRQTKFRHDTIYVRRANFWLDMRLFFYSIWLAFRKAWD